MKTANPLLVSLSEAAFQLSLPKEDLVGLVKEGELTAVQVRGQVLVVFDSLTALAKRARRSQTRPPRRRRIRSARNLSK